MLSLIALPILRLGLAAALAAAAPVQNAAPPVSAEPNPKDNIGHRRHFHRHNAPHPSAPDASRFTTSRSSDVVLPLPHEKDAFTFVVFGDRTGGPDAGVSVLADAVRDVNLLEPDLVMTVGDLIQGYNEEPQWMVQMREFKGIMDQLLCPWFPVAGNHDTYWRGRGTKPVGEHDANYEMHFGPLWYAFEHKNSWFIALYSDETNPQTGEKNFNKPECQKMSPEQFDWLAQTLKKAKDADHVFLFLHHPRWLKGNYGEDWDRVHDLLKAAGNVTAVFAGHIHRMRYDGPRDAIEYVTLATVGGHQDGRVPSAGWLHHYHVVTVRKQQVAMACVPVGEVMDVREITGALATACENLNIMPLPRVAPLMVEKDGRVAAEVSYKISNPVDREIEVTLTPDSRDSRWVFRPDHEHRVIKPGESAEFAFSVRRGTGVIDDTFRPAEVVLDIDYLTAGARYPIPTRRLELPLDVSLHAPTPPPHERWMRFDGKAAHLAVDSGDVEMPDGPVTLECWFNARSYAARTGLVTKTESSDYGIFVNRGVPEWSIYIGSSYLSVKAPSPILATDRWHHVAGVYDGKQARLYVDGKLVASAEREGPRKRNALPLMIGADVTGRRAATSHFDGAIDGLRLSSSARYTGESFTPQRRCSADESTVLLLNFDGMLGTWLLDEGPRRLRPAVRGAMLEDEQPAASATP